MTTASWARVRRASGSRAPGPKVPARCTGRCCPRVCYAFELTRCRSVVPSCTCSSQGVASRPVSNFVSIGILGSAWSRCRSAGRSERGQQVYRLRLLAEGPESGWLGWCWCWRRWTRGMTNHRVANSPARAAARSDAHAPRTKLAASWTAPTSASSSRIRPAIAYRWPVVTSWGRSRWRNTIRW